MAGGSRAYARWGKYEMLNGLDLAAPGLFGSDVCIYFTSCIQPFVIPHGGGGPGRSNQVL